MCKVIAIANQKGGVGKTTTAVNLGILNIIIVVGAIAAYCNTGSWDLVKQGLIFLAIESVVLGVPQFCASGVRSLHERLQMFLWAW